MTTESKVVCELVDSLLSQPALLEAISRNLDVPRNLPANTNSSDASACTSSRNDCSGAIPRSNYNTRFQNQAHEVEYEVQHISSRGTPSVQIEPSNSLTQHDHRLPRQDMDSRIQSPMYHFTRNFGRQNSQRAQQTKYSKRNFRGPSTFTKEIILLPGPQEEIVVKQGSKQYLYESGHIITMFEFDKMWTSKEVLENLHRAFSPKIDNVDIQLLMPCHNKLVKPLLMNEQTLSGLLISKVFKQKSVYLLPSKVILEVPDKNVQDKVLEEKSELFTWLESGQNNNISADSECAHKLDGLDIPQAAHPNTSSVSANTVEENILWATAPSTNKPQENHMEITCSFQTSSSEFQNDFHLTMSHGETSESRRDHYRQYTELLDYGLIPDDDDLDNSTINITAEIDEHESESDDITLKDLLSNLALQIDCEKVSKFNINRRDIWDGARRGFLRKTFKATNRLSVIFTDTSGKSEGAVDYGGPAREFLRLLIHHLQNCKLFEGRENKKTLSCDAHGVRNDDYYLAAQAMAVSLVHGGPAPNFLSPLLYSCLISDTKSIHPSLEDVSDTETQEMLREVQMKDGLRQLGVLHAMEIHKELFEEAFIWKPNPITVDTVNALFSITFSLPGSNYRTIEEKVIGYWRDYLQDCEELSCEATLEDVLCFITGADVVPPLGFSPQPSIEFLHKCDGEQQMSKFSEANTCRNVLRLPLLQSYEEFRESMDFAILNSPGFGRA